ncbi:MAG: class I SAM-dependent methyltransferase [Deltaproteobacteria bacterium]|nr:class I SAM-dependent methyltransferase [Deltaproteobacteria bacterium]PWB67544.1 MAG: class I SAM-dependent methyltransferase [Deltaproteobacteria bacterium]
MAEPLAASPDPISQKCLSFLRDLLEGLHPRDFAVRLWDGSTLEEERGEPRRFTMVLKHPGALRALFQSPSELSLGEAYLVDDFDIEGDIGSAFSLADHLVRLDPGVGERLRFAWRLSSLPSPARGRAVRPSERLHGDRHSRVRDRQAVTYHYDVSNDFYALWLDARMVYSCACFASPEEDLDTAQERKLDTLCRKLRLRRGERLLDIGAGWGGLVLYAALRYGVEAVGITLSRPQAELANERIREAGLAGRCRVTVCDYRDIDGRESFDKLVSVGMFEHVGESRLEEYFGRAFRLLRTGGVFLNHGIASNPAAPPIPGPSFSDHYVFPDGELLPISSTLRAAEAKGFEVRDVESLREHYVLTLMHWVRRLEARREEACRAAGETAYRLWRLYMAGAAHKFRTGRNNVYQALLSKPDRGASGLPLSRADWYA